MGSASLNTPMAASDQSAPTIDPASVTWDAPAAGELAQSAVPVDATHGVIERPGQLPPPIAPQGAINPNDVKWDAPAPKPATPYETVKAASIPAANAVMSAAGGPMGLAPIVAGGLAGTGALAAEKFAPKALEYAKAVAKIAGAGYVLEHLPSGQKILHLFHDSGEGEGKGD